MTPTPAIAVRAAIENHLASFWPNRAHREIHVADEQVVHDLPGFMVREYKPMSGRDPWVYITIGASLVGSGEPGAEFFLLSPVADEQHAKSLAIVAHYNVFHPLRGGTAVEFGRPWMKSSGCKWLYVSSPYTLGPQFESCVGDGFRILFFWLVPIHSNEAQSLRENGAAEFEEQLEKSGVDLIDPRRNSIFGW